MIDKQNFYHGAAIMSIIEHTNCEGVRKSEDGFLINESIFVYIKYTTKNRSPWRFTFSLNEIERLREVCSKYNKVYIVLICAGDGVTSITSKEFKDLIGNKPGWICVKRKFREQYAVSGSMAELKYKISYNRWPNIIFN